MTLDQALIEPEKTCEECGCTLYGYSVYEGACEECALKDAFESDESGEQTMNIYECGHRYLVAADIFDAKKILLEEGIRYPIIRIPNDKQITLVAVRADVRDTRTAKEWAAILKPGLIPEV